MAKPSVLVIAEAANPEWVSVPLVGFHVSQALRDVADVHMVTQVRNREALLRTGLCEGRDFTAIDSEAVAASIYRVSEVLRGGAGKGWTTLAALSALSYVWFERLLWRRFKEDLARGRFAIVHRVTPLSPTTPSVITRELARIGVPFVLGPLNGGLPWPRGFDQVRRAEREWLSYVRGLYRLLPGLERSRRDARAIIVASRHTRRELEQRHSEKLVYIPENGIDVDRFQVRSRSASGPLRVGFVGRLVPYKGADMVIEACAPLLQRGDLTLDVIGDGPERERLEALVRSLGIESGIRLLGWLDQAHVADALRSFDVFAFPSVREFGGGAVLEAMACGVPPITMDYGGPGELVTNDVGYLIPMGPRQSIVDALRRILSNASERRDELDLRARAARARVERWFTWHKKAEQIRSVYDWVLGRGSKPDFGMPFGAA